jgi:hypothetical protein
MEYIGWDFERFSAIDTNSYMGITKSTFEVIKIAKERGYPRVMIIEDDCGFMPYSKDLLEQIENDCPDLKFAMFNLGPTQNRPINVSDKHDLLFDMTNTPEAPEEYYFALDDYTYRFIVQKHQSYCPVLPIAPQKTNYSNISEGVYNNWYMQTYNWNRWCPRKIPNEFMDQYKVQEMKDKNEHHKFYYVN